MMVTAPSQVYLHLRLHSRLSNEAVRWEPDNSSCCCYAPTVSHFEALTWRCLVQAH
jgi:hypothetical protein